MAPSLVACDDNDTVLRTLVYSKAEACKTTFLFLFFFFLFSFFLYSLPYHFNSTIVYSRVRRVTKEPQPQRSGSLRDTVGQTSISQTRDWYDVEISTYLSTEFLLLLFFFLFLHTQWKKRVRSKGSRDSLNLDCYS